MTPASRPRHPRHINGRKDRRYTITREFCGYSKPQWVVRFCGDWIGRAAQRTDALSIALGHHNSRNRRLGLLPNAS